MALGPKNLRQPDVEDLENIRALESRIDNSREFMHFRYGTVKVAIDSLFMNSFLKRRGDIRKKAVIEKYIDAGWFSVQFCDDGIEFSEVDPSEGRS